MKKSIKNVWHRMKKFFTPKKIILILLIGLTCICTYELVNNLSYPFVEKKAELYLCAKYKAKPSEIELVDYKHSKVYLDEYKIFFVIPKWTDFSFEFEYNGKQVFVNRYKGTFYDDYQLDEIEQWCTQWLQENVDERIIGLQIESTDIIWYQKHTLKWQYHIFDSDETEKFLNCYSFNKFYDPSFVIYFYDENIKNGKFSETGDEIKSELNDSLNLNDKILMDYENSYMVIDSSKDNKSEWVHFYVTYNEYKNLHND